MSFVLALLLSGCPPTGKGGGTPAPETSPSTAAPASATTTSSGVTSWSAQAERCCARLDEVVAKVEAGDRPAALAAREKAYFEEYENQEWNLEVASGRYLPEEPLDGRPRSVVQVREQAFADLLAAVKKNAPLEKVRALVQELETKIRADAKALDAQKAPR